jgi:hypothetical protein
LPTESDAFVSDENPATVWWWWRYDFWRLDVWLYTK